MQEWFLVIPKSQMNQIRKEFAEMRKTDLSAHGVRKLNISLGKKYAIPTHVSEMKPGEKFGMIGWSESAFRDGIRQGDAYIYLMNFVDELAGFCAENAWGGAVHTSSVQAPIIEWVREEERDG